MEENFQVNDDGLNVQSTSEKIEALNELAWALRNKDEARSWALSQQAYDLAHREKIPKQIAFSLTTLAYLNHYCTANFEVALAQSQEAVALLEQVNHTAGLPPALNIAGLSYVRLGDPSEAMEYHLRALKICEDEGDKINEAEVYNHIAIIYVYWGDHRQALRYFNKSLALQQEIGNQFGQAIALINRCMTFKDLGNYQNALTSGLLSLKLLRKIQAQWPITMALSNVANVYLALGQTQAALNHFNQSLASANQFDDKFTHVYALLNAARAYYQLANYELARVHLYQGLKIAKESGQKGFQLECHELLAQTFKAEEDFEQALLHYEKFHQLNREVFNEQSDRRLKNLEVRHRTEIAQKEAQVYQLRNVELERKIVERRKLEAELKSANAEISHFNQELEKKVRNRTKALQEAYDTTLAGWGHALELRDSETEGHSQRVTHLTLRLGRAMGLDEKDLIHIRRGALLHDIGKMGIPDAILLKAGPLTAEEMEIMQQHPQYAYELLKNIAFLQPALDIPRYHHERWDGAGYNHGLKGQQIPLAARIFAVVDVWDALTTTRPYHTAWPKDKAQAYISEQAGRQFDPDVVSAFLHIIAEETT